MDEHRQVSSRPQQLHQRVHRGIVRQVAVDQRMELEAQELRVLEEAFHLLDMSRHARVPPDERVRLGYRLHDRLHVLVVWIEHEAAVVAVLLDDRRESVAVERDPEQRPEVAHVHVGVEDHVSNRLVALYAGFVRVAC